MTRHFGTYVSGLAAGVVLAAAVSLLAQVSGGRDGAAFGDYSAIVGGENGSTNGDYSVVTGGDTTIASGSHTVVP